MFNKDVKIAKSTGVDLPIMRVYLAGRISGDRIGSCLTWRQGIINYYKNYKNRGAYPISFLCPLNSGEASSVDKQGLTSSIPPNLIYDKDLLSVETADVIVANMDDFFEEDIKDLLSVKSWRELPTNGNLDSTIDKLPDGKELDFKEAFYTLKIKILDRRENLGTVFEISWALYLQKPLILIVPERRREIFEKHPFTKRASVIVTSVDELTEGMYFNLLYKSIASATY